MENYLAEDSSLELQFDASGREALENGSWWAKFISITVIVFLGLILIGVIVFMSSDGITRLQYQYGFTGLAAVVWAIIAVVLLVSGILMATLLGFATKTSRGSREMDQGLLESGIGSLRTYMIIYGIVAALSLIITFLTLLF